MVDTVRLRTEITTAIDFINPEIRGLTDLTKTSISADSLNEVNIALKIRTRRLSLLQGVISYIDYLERAIQNLKNDGYPTLPYIQVTQSVFNDLTEQKSDFTSAIGVFKLANATSLTIRLGDPKQKIT